MKLYSIVLIFFLAISQVAHSSERYLHVGYTPLCPFIYKGNGGSLRGIYVDVLSVALEKRLGYKIKYTSYPYRRLEYSLSKGLIDAYIGVGSESKNVVKGNVPIAVGMMSVFTYKDHPREQEISNIELISDIQGFKVVSHIGDQWTQQYLKNVEVDTSARDYSQALRKLAKKRGDIALFYEIIGVNTIRLEDLSDQVMLASKLTTNPVLHELILLESDEHVGFLSKLDEMLIEMLNDGTTRSIYKSHKYQTALDVEGTTEENKVRFAHYAGNSAGEAINQLVNDYNSKNSFKIKPLYLDVIPYKNTIKYALLSQSPPELLMSWAGYRTKFLVDNNLILPLEMTGSVAKRFDKQSIANVTYNNKVYAVPWSQHIIPIIYNKHLFSKYSVSFPANWNELLGVCAIFSKNNVVPFALGSKNKWPAQFWFDYLLVRSAGKLFREKLVAGEKHFTDPKVKRVFQLWQTLLTNGCIDKQNTINDYYSSSEKIATGQAAMTLMGTWAAGDFENRFSLKYGVDFDIAQFPSIDKGIASHLFSVQDIIVRTKNSKDEQIHSVLEFFSLKKTQLIYSRASNAIAPNIPLDQSQYSPLQRRMSDFVRENPHDVTAFDLSTPPLVAEIAMDLFKDFLLNPDTIDQLLIDADKKMQQAYKTHRLEF